MSRERDLLARVLTSELWSVQEELQAEIKELLSQPEQNKAEAIMPNGVCVSNVYDAYEEGRKSVMSEQEPIAWIMHNKETGYRVQAAYRPSALKKGWEAIPLYAGSPTCEPLSDEKLAIMYSKHAFAMDKQEYMWGFRDAEKEHGIGF